MEEQKPMEIFTNLYVDERSKETLYSIAKWCLITAIAGFVSYIIVLINAIVDKNPGTERYEGFNAGFRLTTSNIGTSILVIIIGVTLNYFLYRFSTQLRNGLDSMNQEKFGSSFINLKTYFAILSILILIVGVIVLLALLVTL
ncbi:MAG TPA: hypothetical protein VFP87_00595 [Chitinophagaceae bacterium]|nr:hypothetical protein [Chitinophagaceae bacterium]